MAYNPFDDVIDSDPAYMQTGGELQRSVLPQRRVNYDQETFKPIATAISKGYQLLTPEQDTLNEIEKNKQLRALSTAQALKGTQFEEYAGQADLPSAVIQSPGIKERLDEAGYKPQGFIEGMSRTGQFFYGDQRQAFDKLAQGQQLTDQDRTAVAFAPLDTLDFLFPPLAIKKLGSIGLKTVDDVLKSTSELEEVKQIKNYFGGQGFTPAGVVREADMGGSAPIKTAKTGTIAERVTTYLDQLPEGQLVGMTKLAQDNNITNRQLRAVLDEKKYKSYLNKIDKTIVEVQGSKAQEVKNFLENVSGTTTYKEIADSLNMTVPSVRDIIKAKTIGTLKNKIVLGKSGDMADNVRDYIKNLDEPVSYEFLADELGIDLRQASSTINFITKTNPELSAKVFTDYGKKDFGQGLERPIEFLKRTFDKMPTGEKITKKELKKKYGLSNDNINQFLVKNKSYNEYIEAPKVKFKKTIGAPVNTVKPVLNEFRNNLGIQPNSRPEFLFFDGLLRSSSPEAFGLDPSLYSKKDFYRLVMSDFAEYNPNWRQTFAKDLETMKSLEKDRDATNIKMKDYFDEMKKKNPKVMKDLNFTDYRLNVAHNIPLGLSGKDFPEVGGLTGAARLSFAKTNLKHHKRLEELLTENLNEIKEQGLIEKTADGKVKVPSDFNKFLSYLDEEANKLGTVIYFKLGDKVQKVGMEATPSPESLLSSFKNHINGLVRNKKKYSPKKTEDEFTQAKVFLTSKKEKEYFDDVTDLAKGGEVKPVRMAIGGDPLTNINQQQFAPDPALNDDYFQEAVQSGNLQAFNPTKIFKLFNKTNAVYTPKKLPDPVDTQQAAPPGTTLPTTQTVQPEDFAFQSFTLNKIQDPQAPKAGTPEAWKQFLYGGGQGGKAPESEMFDSGIEQYLDDYAKYFPNKKLTQEELADYYEMSPIGNIQVKVKEDRGNLRNDTTMNPEYKQYVGTSRHQNMGNQPLDEQGTNYREVVVNSGKLPGEKNPFVQSSHYDEDNVLGFTRVADYQQANGSPVAVIQELQTDMLTKVRKEQERLQAVFKRIANVKAKAERELASPDGFTQQTGQRTLDNLNAEYPPAVLDSLQKNQDLIKPFPNEAAKSTIPGYAQQLQDLQTQIDNILKTDISQSKPETGFQIKKISDDQNAILESLLDLNRSGQLDDILKNVKVPNMSRSDDLLEYGSDTNVRGTASGYSNLKSLELFPPVPFNKQADYVDLLIKATVKDAQSKGVNKVAIYPPDLVNRRWSKTPDSDAGKKFNDLYGKVAVQQMKNIAKKYGGTAKFETIIDTSRPTKGLRYLQKNVAGDKFEFMKEDVVRRNTSTEDTNSFFDEQIKRIVSDIREDPGFKVALTREIAPNQTMDYFVKTADNEKGYILQPLGDGDRLEDAFIVIEEFNPQEVPMFTITLESDKAKAPMFMFKKKDGGTIAKDSLVSITDIYGQYGR